MFGRAIRDIFGECIFENFEIAQLKLTRVIYPKNDWLITPDQKTLCVETDIF